MADKYELPSTYVDGFHDREAVRRMRYRPLGRTGMVVSILSLGASSLGSVFRATSDDEAVNVVRTAIRNGINLIDTAAWYGHGKSENVLGKALEGIPREAYYITTKACRYLPDVDKMFDFTAERTLRSIDESLHRMKLDYVDVLQVHDPEFAPSLDIVCNETLPAMQQIKDARKCRFIGLTGYPMGNFRKMIEGTSVKIDTVLCYCHFSMNDTSLTDHLSYFEEQGIGVINASPISMGLLSNRGPPSWHPATDDIKAACKEAADYCQMQNVDISKLATHFTLSNDNIPTTLVSTASLANLTKNLQAVSESLSEHEQQVSAHIMKHYFHPLGNKTWEGVEVQKYWQEMKKLSK
ncbi:uncharacterized protein LOC134186264 [Corticium candelabrum]|uniref:uncharacterized protein LOC134186264 n=1 Tax=Corticium candelabrum TaxID=121492 RepID=UPI002E26EAD4|nr:uncharacterized protein LOC134186264 [Corticium candelabrum]